ncbi:MAG: hypothetical protein ACRELX_04715, partial [Longimicrobiales bacterium]
METPRSSLHTPAHRPKAYVETYGCQMNVADGELMQGILGARGFDLADRPEDADVILVNTCAIREHAEQRVLGRVGELNRIKASNPDVVIGVTGCMAQRMGETLLARAPYVDLVMGPDGYRSLPDVLARLRPQLVTGTASTSAEAEAEAKAKAGATDTATAKDFREPSSSNRRSLPVLPVAAPGTADVSAASTPKRLAVVEFAGGENYEGLEVRRTSDISAWVPIQRGCNHRCTYC